MKWNEITQNRGRRVVARVGFLKRVEAPIFDWVRNGSSVRLYDPDGGIDIRVPPKDILRFVKDDGK